MILHVQSHLLNFIFLKGRQHLPSQEISSHCLAQEATLCWSQLQLTPINKRGKSTRALSLFHGRSPFCRRFWTSPGVCGLVPAPSSVTGDIQKGKAPQCAQDLFVFAQLWEFNPSSLRKGKEKGKGKALCELFLDKHTHQVGWKEISWLCWSSAALWLSGAFLQSFNMCSLGYSATAFSSDLKWALL